MIVLFTLIHELGHCLTAKILGGKCYEIGFEEGRAFALIETNNVWASRYVIMAGSFFGFSSASIISKVFKKKLNISAYSVCNGYIFAEIVYWMSCEESSDAYVLFQTTNNEDLVLLGMVLLVLLMYLFINYLINIKKICDEKYGNWKQAKEILE